MPFYVILFLYPSLSMYFLSHDVVFDLNEVLKRGKGLLQS